MTTVENQRVIFGAKTTLYPVKTDDDSWLEPVDYDVAITISAEISRRYRFIPFQMVGNRIHIAVVDSDRDLINVLSMMKHGAIVCHDIDPIDLEYAQDRVFGLPNDLVDRRLGGILFVDGKISSKSLVEVLKAQPHNGGKLGALLAATSTLNHWDVAQALGKQFDMPVVSLLEARSLSNTGMNSVNCNVWGVMDEAFWSEHFVVPIFEDARSIAVAMVDPQDQDAVLEIERQFQKSVRVFVTGYRDVITVLKAKYSEGHDLKSRLQLKEKSPDESAARQLTRQQGWVIIALVAALVLGLVYDWTLAGTIVMVLVQLLYALSSLFRLWMTIRVVSSKTQKGVYDKLLLDGECVSERSLPTYSILVPLYKEAGVLPILSQALMKMQYPKDRLDVKFLLEEDDLDTIQAARDAKLPNFIELVIVPDSHPKTKPKACNFGLQTARGEFVVIYDAEDIPEEDQLIKAISMFRNSDEKLACVQAKLSYYNHSQNILTRWFTSEYMMWFDMFLPALFSGNMPVPLGGTSNHFKTRILKELGAWDPYNVTEDADLGIRLYKHGYHTAVLESITFEEANSEFVNWIRQRSRWVKGYIQTWLVHMRHPIKLTKELGFLGSLGFHMMIGGTPFIFLLNPILWALTFSWFVFGPNFEVQLLPSWIYYLAGVNWIMGNFIFSYVNVIALTRRGAWDLVKYALLSPIYWLFMSIAAWKGMIQIFTRPSYWEKTTHGLATVPTDFSNGFNQSL